MSDRALAPVCVLWRDAAGEDRRCNSHELPDLTPLLLHSVGWLVADEQEHITLVMDWWENADRTVTWRNWLAIPRSCVVAIEPLGLLPPEALP
jgi:hypothetical protein